MATITDLLPKGAIVVDEGLTTAASLAAFLPIRDRYAYFGNVSGGIGWGIAAAVGVQLAQPDRRVVALLGDGSAMYSIQALWTAAHHKLPMTFVLFNNGGYRIIKQRLKLFHSTDRFIGMDFTDPPIEFAALAAALGVQGHRVEPPAAFKAAFADAVAANEPAGSNRLKPEIKRSSERNVRLLFIRLFSRFRFTGISFGRRDVGAQLTSITQKPRDRA